jgi:hypothetical protein
MVGRLVCWCGGADAGRWNKRMTRHLSRTNHRPARGRLMRSAHFYQIDRHLFLNLIVPVAASLITTYSALPVRLIKSTVKETTIRGISMWSPTSSILLRALKYNVRLLSPGTSVRYFYAVTGVMRCFRTVAQCE